MFFLSRLAIELRRAWGIGHSPPENFKSECPLISREDWHVMKNQNPSFFVQRYLLVVLETRCDFFLETFFPIPKRKNSGKTRFGPTRLKTPTPVLTGLGIRA